MGGGKVRLLQFVHVPLNVVTGPMPYLREQRDQASIRPRSVERGNQPMVAILCPMKSLQFVHVPLNVVTRSEEWLAELRSQLQFVHVPLNVVTRRALDSLFPEIPSFNSSTFR